MAFRALVVPVGGLGQEVSSLEMGRLTMMRVLTTHSGLVHIVLAAPAVMADATCNGSDFLFSVGGSRECAACQDQQGGLPDTVARTVSNWFDRSQCFFSKVCLYGIVDGEIDCPGW